MAYGNLKNANRRMHVFRFVKNLVNLRSSASEKECFFDLKRTVFFMDLPQRQPPP